MTRKALWSFAVAAAIVGLAGSQDRPEALRLQAFAYDFRSHKLLGYGEAVLEAKAGQKGSLAWTAFDKSFEFTLEYHLREMRTADLCYFAITPPKREPPLEDPAADGLEVVGPAREGRPLQRMAFKSADARARARGAWKKKIQEKR